MTPPIGMLMPYNNHTFPGDCEATERFTAEQICAAKQERWVNWYIADYVYAQPTVILICVFIGLFSITHRLWLAHAAKQAKHRSPFYYRTVALFRWLAIKHFRIRGWSSISLGNCLIIGGLGLFFLLMTVAPTPYYWPELGWAHSPPLGTRTGWLALALLPFLITLASKRNPIALLSGLSHERLQVFHRWCAFFMLLLGLIHTFAFIKYNADAGTSIEMWTTSSSYWTGVAMLVPQLWLTLMSLAPIRNKYYEFFKVTHRMVAIIFLVFFFLHCAWTLTSWDYFWALLAVYGSALVTRVVLIIRNKIILRNRHAHLRVVGNSLLEIRIPDSGLNWHAGQHFFFRFTGLNFFDAWQSHPFTACTVPTHEGSDIVALAKIRRGLMLDLANHAYWQAGIRADAWIDGPYGPSLKLLPAYEHVLLLGGGSGLSYITSAANELVHTYGKRDFSIVACCRDKSQLQTYLDLLPVQTESRYHLQAHSTGIPIHMNELEKGPVVGEASDVKAEKTCCSNSADPSGANSPNVSSEDSISLEEHRESSGCHKSTSASSGKNEIKHEMHFADIKSARPGLRDIIRAEAGKSSGSRLAIVACGPESFMRDVQEEVASLQMSILRGARGVKEVYLRSEAFHW